MAAVKYSLGIKMSLKIFTIYTVLPRTHRFQRYYIKLCMQLTKMFDETLKPSYL